MGICLFLYFCHRHVASGEVDLLTRPWPWRAWHAREAT